MEDGSKDSGPGIPAHFANLEAYRPGRPIDEVERELGLSGTIKLASNENALGPSPLALEAAREALIEVHRYPDGGAWHLASALSKHLGVERERIVFGNGSNEVLELLFRVLAGPGDEVVVSSDAFVVYRLLAESLQCRAVAVPAKAYGHDLMAMADAVTDRTRIIAVANPNNPTGTAFDRETWEAFLARVPQSVCVILDEAYFEFVEDESLPDGGDYLDRPNVVVTRTFSKAYGLAGLRIGYAIAPLPLADALSRLREPFNTSLVAQAAAVAALGDTEHLEASRGLVRRGRAAFEEALAAMGLRHVPSHGNFVLVDVGDGPKITEAMLHEGVIVRPMGPYAMPSMIRITYGTDAENARCLEVLARVTAPGFSQGDA